jgi:hypothetical protein
MAEIDLRSLSREQKERLALLLAERKRRRGQRKFYCMFPPEDTIQPDGSTVHSRLKYPKHLEFFEAGAKYRERCFMAANRIGKSTTGAFELTTHLTGLYPDWWDGKRFSTPIRAWAAGKTNETTRDIVQVAETTRQSCTARMPMSRNAPPWAGSSGR